MHFSFEVTLVRSIIGSFLNHKSRRSRMHLSQEVPLEQETVSKVTGGLSKSRLCFGVLLWHDSPRVLGKYNTNNILWKAMDPPASKKYDTKECVYERLEVIALFARLSYGIDSNVTQLYTSQPVYQAICILLFCQLYLVILFPKKYYYYYHYYYYY